MSIDLPAQLVGLLAPVFSVSSVVMKCDRRLRLAAATGQVCRTAVHPADAVSRPSGTML